MKVSDILTSKNITFKNRIIMPPMATAKFDENGHITKEILNYYEEKTSNKLFACVIVEHSFVDPRGKTRKNQISIADDSDIIGLKKLADLIHNNESLAIAQLSHAGSSTNEAIIGQRPLGPSEILNPSNQKADMPKELSKKDIENLVEKFVHAAIRAKEAGFDGIEIHSAHGYLLNQFLSPLTNKRTDEYGGDIYGRIKIHLDIIKKIREELGQSFPIFLRLGAGDNREDGLSIDDAVKAANEFEKVGVDILDISGGMCLFMVDDQRPGFFDNLSKPIFDSVDIPVILTGGVKTGKDIEEILKRNVCDLVGVGRSVFKDSSWMNKEARPYL